MSFEIKIGDRIRAYRIKQKMTVKELAEKIGEHQPSITRFENDQRQPDLDKLVKICRALEITPNDLLREYLPDGRSEVIASGDVTKEQLDAAIVFLEKMKTQAN